MDDSFHGIQGGFLITTNYSYYETFSIEGSSPSFQETCGVIYGDYYSSDSYTYQYSEDFMINRANVIGTSLYVVFDVLIKYPGEEYFHKIIITENVFITVDGEAIENEGNTADQETEENKTNDIDGFPIFQIGIIFIIGATGLSMLVLRKHEKKFKGYYF